MEKMLSGLMPLVLGLAIWNWGFDKPITMRVVFVMAAATISYHLIRKVTDRGYRR